MHNGHLRHPAPVDPYTFLHASHRELDQLLDGLLAALAGDDRDEIRRYWSRFEAVLLAHMEAEERFVIPNFAPSHFAEAAALLREHGAIREQLLELGVAIDLHYLRLGAGQELVERLRSHARREDELLYRWASERLEHGLVAATWQHLNRAADHAPQT